MGGLLLLVSVPQLMPQHTLGVRNRVERILCERGVPNCRASSRPLTRDYLLGAVTPISALSVTGVFR
eukprot:6180958-Pleurochrysis_carterae.AAC.1